MTYRFHLSIVVPDLAAAKWFYTETLGCNVGRDQGEWMDVGFFGHQLTIHQQRAGLVASPVDHFGPILSKSEWLNLSRRLGQGGVIFQLPPLIKNERTAMESGKFIVRDPADNVLEFKYYARDTALPTC